MFHERRVEFLSHPLLVDTVRREHNHDGGRTVKTFFEQLVDQTVAGKHFPAIQPRIDALCPQPAREVEHEAVLVLRRMTDEHFWWYGCALPNFARSGDILPGLRPKSK
jgi:hypothetical protein